MKAKLSSHFTKMISFRLYRYYEHQNNYIAILEWKVLVQKHCLCFSDQSHYLNMIPSFARAVMQMYMITNMIMFDIYHSFFFVFFLHFLLDFNQQWSSPESLSSFANEVKQKEVSLQTWWVLLMARCVLFVDHSKIKEYFKMGIKEFMHLS